MKLLPCILIFLSVSSQSLGAPVSIGQNLLDSFGKNAQLQGFSISLTAEDTNSVTRVESKDFTLFFPDYRLFRCKFHLTLGYHHQYEWCLVLATKRNEVLQVQKRFYWSGINEHFWNDLESAPIEDDTILVAFNAVIDMIYTLEEVYLDSPAVPLQQPPSPLSYDMVNSRPIVQNESISTEFYRSVHDENSSTMKALRPSFVMWGILSERLTIRVAKL